MKLPLIAPIDSRDGTSNKDARQYNTLVETDAGAKSVKNDSGVRVVKSGSGFKIIKDDDGVTLVGVRPGLTAISTATGNGSGAVSFNGVLITVFGTNVAYGETPTTIAAVAAETYDFAQSPL